MDKRISDMNTLGTPDDSDYIEVLDTSEILPDNKNKKMTLLTFKTWITNAFTLPNHKNTHTVGGTDAFLATDLIDAVARIRVWFGNVLTGTRRGINFIPGTNVTLNVTDDVVNERVNVTINATGAGIGDITNAANLGGQQELFINKAGGVLNFRTLEGLGATTVSTVGDVIQINTPASTGEANDLVNVGTGEGLIRRDKTGVNINVKTIKAGSNITVVNNPDDITISTTAQNNTGTNIGTAAQVYAGMSGNQLQFRTIEGTGSVSVTQNANVITINSNVLNPNIVNVTDITQPNAAGVYKNTIGNNYNFKSIFAGTDILNDSGIRVTSYPDNIEISNRYSLNSTLIKYRQDTRFIHAIDSPVSTNTSVAFGAFILPESGNYTLIGNYNLTNGATITDDGLKVIANCHFRKTANPTEGIVNINSNSQSIYFKDCWFNNSNESTISPMIISGNCHIVFDNCVFYIQEGGGRLSPHIQFVNFTGTCVFKDCILGCNENPLTLVPDAVTSNTPINVTFLGNNYGQVALNANITPLVGTYTIVPTLKYIFPRLF